MKYKKVLSKIFSVYLVFTLLLSRVLISVSPAVAEDLSGPSNPVTAPSSPSSPTNPITAPSSPSGPSNPITAPSSPSGPSNPITAPTAPSAPTNYITPPSSGGYIQISPTSAAAENAQNSGGTGGITPVPSLYQGASGGQAAPTEANTVIGNSDQLSDSGATGYQDSVNDPANTFTGPVSSNEAKEYFESKYEEMNKNLAELNNKISNLSSTGFNYANLNTLDGKVFTGDAYSSLNLLNKLNSNITGTGEFSVTNIYGNQIGDLIFKMAEGKAIDSFTASSGSVSMNEGTGAGSENSADSLNTFKVKEANGNDANIVNDINLQAVSGNNQASLNTGAGNIETGDATALGNIINMANTNLNVSKWLIGVVNIWGSLIGNIILPKDTTDSSAENQAVVTAKNSGTGPQSENSTSYESAAAVEFSNSNIADIATDINAEANTGNNTASYNTGGGYVETGSSETSVKNNTVANSNTVDEEGTVWLVIVNEMGKWVGYIVGNPYGQTTASNSLPLTTQQGGSGPQSYSVLTENGNTGPLSSNDSSYKVSSEESVTNENNAQISNKIIANSETGNNETKYNTGAGTISTGDAKTGINLLNLANTNVTAKKFIALFVNVIGSFTGNVVTPEAQTSPAKPSPTPVPKTTIVPTKAAGPTPTSFIPNTPVISVTPASAGTVYTFQTGPDSSGSDTTPSNQGNMYANFYTGPGFKTTKTAQKFSVTDVSVVYEDQQYNARRGVFLSPAFAKATETSFAATLFGGAVFRITSSWLYIIPFALIVLFLRRRRKFMKHIGKYINSLLEVIL